MLSLDQTASRPSLTSKPFRASVPLVKETLRWRLVTAGGVLHLLVKDNVYDLASADGKSKPSFLLRAGTNIHAN